MEEGYHKGRELTMLELGLSLEELSGQPLELFAREGARLLLTVALEEEVTDFLKRRPYERSQGNIRGYRNGHRERQVSCGAGEIEVAVPRMSDTKEAFHKKARWIPPSLLGGGKRFAVKRSRTGCLKHQMMV